MVRAMDSFDRANNPDLGTAWDKIADEATGLKIASHAAVPPYRTLDAGESNNLVAWHNDQWSEVCCPVLSTNAVSTGLGVALRASVIDRTYYRCVVCVAGAEIAKHVAGAYTQLAVDATPWANNDVVFFKATGTTLQVARNGVDVFNTTDASIASGRPGVCHSSTSTSGATLTLWRGGDDTPDVDTLTVAFVDDQSP